MNRREKLAEQSLFGDRSHLMFVARFKGEKKTGAKKFIATSGAWEDRSNDLGPDLSMSIEQAAAALIENVAYIHAIIFDNEKKQHLKARVLWIDSVISRKTGVRLFLAIVDRKFGQELHTTLLGIRTSSEVAGRMVLMRDTYRNRRTQERAEQAVERLRNEWPRVFGIMVTGEQQDGFYVINADMEEWLRQTVADIGGDPDRAMDELFGEDDNRV